MSEFNGYHFIINSERQAKNTSTRHKTPRNKTPIYRKFNKLIQLFLDWMLFLNTFLAFLVSESRISQVRANIFWWESLTDIQKPSDVFSIYYNWLHYGKTLDAAFCSKSKCLEAVKCNAL